MRHLFLVLLICMLGGAAIAQNFGLAKVVNVAADDVLNVRMEPSASSPILDHLANGALVDVLGTNETGGWSQISIGEGSGWVASRYLAAVTMSFTGAGMPETLQCIGTEPFWSYVVRFGSMTEFAAMGDDLRKRGEVTSVVASSNVGRGALSFQTPHHSAVLSFARCSDGMSDRIYPWMINLMPNSGGPRLLTGCCTAAVSN